MNDLPRRVHIIGIGGSHMSAIARLLLARGVEVAGSDRRPTEITAELEASGARVHAGHRAENVGSAELVVHTAAVGADNPELAEARRRGLPVLTRAEMVAWLMRGKQVIAVAGTHGKTTTSTLLSLILLQAGRSPMYIIGSDSLDLGANAAWGDDPLCVVEADEFRDAFLEYRPDFAIVTNIDPDHLEYFGTADRYRQSFEQFVRRIRPGGTLLACLDDPGAAELLAQAPGGVSGESYGLVEGARWRAVDVRFEQSHAAFVLSRDQEPLGELTVRPPGRHLVQNAVAAAAAALIQGVDFAAVRSAVTAFRGARRRFEEIGEARGITIIDDYAHHPTEVAAVLETARTRFGERRLVVVYQPLTYTRIGYLWDAWLHLWEDVDELIVLETFGSREQPRSPGAAELAEAIRRPPARYAPDVGPAARMALACLREGDVLLTIGADEVCEVGPRVLEMLR